MGTRLVNSYSTPALGDVYKLTAPGEGSDGMVSKLKRSDNPAKITNPGRKRLVRMVDGNDQMRGDVLFLENEDFLGEEALSVFHPMYAHIKKKSPAHFRREDLLRPVFRDGKLVHHLPTLEEVSRNTLHNSHLSRQLE
jgi:nicotinate phosphoribosyltransferase